MTTLHRKCYRTYWLLIYPTCKIVTQDAFITVFTPLNSSTVPEQVNEQFPESERPDSVCVTWLAAELRTTFSDCQKRQISKSACTPKTVLCVCDTVCTVCGLTLSWEWPHNWWCQLESHQIDPKHEAWNSCLVQSICSSTQLQCELSRSFQNYKNKLLWYTTIIVL